jgi:Restriction endonuclease NotI
MPSGSTLRGHTLSELVGNASKRKSETDQTVSYVSEWFGHRVYPTVSNEIEALEAQRGKVCPFLSEVLDRRSFCIKSAASSGICTISSTSNGPRQDWLVCPIRAFRPLLLATCAGLIFEKLDGHKAMILPAPALEQDETRTSVIRTLEGGGDCVVYLQNKLGGEISISKTDRSPELSFDVTMIDIALIEGLPAIKRFGILEIQTMDFHGSYRSAVKNLEDGLRLHGDAFHATLRDNQRWLRDGIEGPNISNVFKRTFYQMMLKFRIGASAICSGTVLAIPVSVWDSWQRHLGKPKLSRDASGRYELRAPSEVAPRETCKNWIVVFDLDSTSEHTPSPLVITMIISTSANALAYYAFEAAPSAAVEDGGPISMISSQIRLRLAQYWPELATGLESKLQKRKPVKRS